MRRKVSSTTPPVPILKRTSLSRRPFPWARDGRERSGEGTSETVDEGVERGFDEGFERGFDEGTSEAGIASRIGPRSRVRPEGKIIMRRKVSSTTPPVPILKRTSLSRRPFPWARDGRERSGEGTSE